MKRRKAGRRPFGAVRQLPSGRWQASYLGPDGKRRVAPNTFITAGDAHAWLGRIEASISDGTWRPPETLTNIPEATAEPFGTYGKRWLANRVDLRQSSKDRYERLWRLYLEASFGDVPLSKMTREDWRVWYAKTCTEHPESTQPGAAYRLARAILNTAVDDEVLAVNPCRVKNAGRQHTSERPVAMPEDVAKVAAAIDDRYRALVLLASYGSLRFGELAGLRRSNINVLHRTVKVEQAAVELSSGRVVFGRPKTDASIREVVIPQPLVPVIEDHLARFVAPSPDALVFTSPEGHPLRRTKFRNRWVKACAQAGISGLHFHDLRGSGATWAATSGATVRELMARLGHTTPTMALRYQHATKERDKAIADRLGALFADSEPDKPRASKSSSGG